MYIFIMFCGHVNMALSLGRSHILQWLDQIKMLLYKSGGTIQQRASGVLKKKKKKKKSSKIPHIRQTHVGNTSKTRYKRVGYTWCTSGARRCTSLKVSARSAHVWAKKMNMLNFFSRSSACLGRVTYTPRIHSTRVTGALSTL